MGTGERHFSLSDLRELHVTELEKLDIAERLQNAERQLAAFRVRNGGDVVKFFEHKKD